MLYSPRKRFIFVKSSKTAGTSIEIALSRHLQDPADIITPLGSSDELLRLAYGGTPPRNCFSRQSMGIKTFNRYLRTSLLGLKLGNRTSHPSKTIEKILEFRYSRNDLALRNHISVDVIIDSLGLERFSKSFSCGFVREPCERAVSQFFWRNRQTDFSNCTANELTQGFLAFLRNEYRSLASQLRGIKHEGMQVTKVYKFEDLYRSYIDICDRLGASEHERLKELPRAKMNVKSGRKLNVPKEQLLTSEAKTIIREKCTWEYVHFYDP